MCVGCWGVVPPCCSCCRCSERERASVARTEINATAFSIFHLCASLWMPARQLTPLAYANTSAHSHALTFIYYLCMLGMATFAASFIHAAWPSKFLSSRRGTQRNWPKIVTVSCATTATTRARRRRTTKRHCSRAVAVATAAAVSADSAARAGCQLPYAFSCNGQRRQSSVLISTSS